MLLKTAIKKDFVKIMEKDSRFVIFIKPECPSKAFIKFQFRMLDIYYPAGINALSEPN